MVESEYERPSGNADLCKWVFCGDSDFSSNHTVVLDLNP